MSTGGRTSDVSAAGYAGTIGATISPSCVLALDCGDTYEGAVQTKNGITLPHGQGVWRSADGALRYEGHFVQRWRDGYGRLCTPTFTLWARWRMDRPDLSSTTRVDYANGDRYSGFVELRATSTGGASKTHSKFRMWAAAMQPVRQRFGELVMQSGDTYIGEWKDDEREGFGCYIWASGSRYTGRHHRGQFSDVGTLFIAAAEVDGCLTRLSSGGWRCGSAREGARRTTDQSEVCCGVARWPPPSRPSWDGVIVDVVWAEGRCRGEGHVTLPGGVRLSADWRSCSSPVDGELVLPTLSPQARVDPEVHEWRESFQWESLFSSSGTSSAGAVRAGGQHEILTEKVSSIRANIQQSNSTEFVKSCVVELLNTHDLIKTTLHVFRRCFYGLYGTCGAETTIGGGGGGGDGAGNLGWCALRNPYGGCIHAGRGRPIQPGDLDLALRDIASLARSTVRWVLETLGPELQTKALDCGGEAVVGRWVADHVFQHCYPVLLNLYSCVYAAEEAALAASVARLRDAVTLDDMGVLFARQSASQARLFDPYTDAVHCVEQLNGEAQTLTKLLKVLVQWSREIDLSTRLTQASQEPRASKSAETAAAGSADDLLPIHQYVLSQSHCAHLYAVTRLLYDFAGESLFMEATSQEAFGVTTLQVCVLTLLHLHPWGRDEANILVPLSVELDRVTAAARHRAAVAAWTCAALYSSSEANDDGSSSGGGGAASVEEVEEFMAHYVRLWVPRLVGWAGEHFNAAATPPCSYSLCECGFNAEELALVHLDPALCGEAVCLGCWLYASVLLGSLHLRLHVDSMLLPSRLQNLDDVKQTYALLRGHFQDGKAALELSVDVEPSTRLIPSRMLRMEVYMCELLNRQESS